VITLSVKERDFAVNRHLNRHSCRNLANLRQRFMLVKAGLGASRDAQVFVATDL
jgi:hypothetical protein